MLPDALVQALTKLCDMYLDLALLISIASFNFAAYVWRDFKATVLTSKEHKGKAIFERDVLSTSSEESACDPEQQKDIVHDVC
ncbi:hypothetical protein BV898_16829 [Hypsibius exemplaris]|uniref:Uncharacterized protein n=1 Tax=Hypsibius exemplaris TaxID=2072580 RepID=A0A9X6NMM3_HYPEX|nr:hypothetical protein BV898_16829 [Hypsibius exemplaris]